MTTPPAAGSGQALPARVVPQTVVDAIEAYSNAVFNYHRNPAEILRRTVAVTHAALVAAIADAIEEARRDSERYRAALQTISFAKADRLDHSIDADLLDKAGRIARKALRP